MWGKIRKFFARQAVPHLEEAPVLLATGEPTSVGVGFERELRDLAVLAREFEPLFAYRTDLIALVTELKVNQDLSSIRKTLQEATEEERNTLRQSLEGFKPQLAQLTQTQAGAELQEKLQVLLATLETALPSRISLDQFHHLYALELMRLPAQPPVNTQVVNPMVKNPTLEELVADAPLEQSVYEQSLEAQGKTVAELQVLMLRSQDNTLSEYQDFVAALTSLQLAQESNLISPELVLRARESYHRFESARQQQAQSQREAQKQRVEHYLSALQALPELAAMKTQAESTKRVLDDYLTQLNVAPLDDNALASAGALFDNFKKQLDLSYRSELMNLANRAASVKATAILIELQHAGQLLEQGKYANLAGLSSSLQHLLEGDKHRLLSQRRTEKFAEKLRTALADFAPLARLNNEEVDSVRQSLAFLESQREHFQKASLIAQQDLEKLLTQSKAKLKRLAKQYEATSAVAEELVTSHLLDTFFGDKVDAKSTGVVSQTASTPLSSNL